MKTWKNSYQTYASFTIAAWGLSFVFSRISLQNMHSNTLGLLRNLIASIALIFAIYLLKIPAFERKDTMKFIISGGTGFFLFMYTFNNGAQLVTAATSSVVLATAPIFTALIARIFYQEKLKGFQWIAILIGFGGILLLAKGQGDISANHGVIWLLLASLSLSIYNIVQRRLNKKYTSFQVSVYSILIGTIPFIFFIPQSISDIKTFSLPIIGIVLTLGLIGTAAAYISWSKAFSLAENTSQVSNYMFITPILATVFGIIIIQEIPDKNFLLSAGIVLFALLLFNKGQVIFLKSTVD